MNTEQIKYLKRYLRDKINSCGSKNYKSYSIEFNGLLFNFESVAIYSMSLICKNHSMTYKFDNSFITCGCGVKNCIHKKELNNLIKSILDDKK
jgi:hypothetical protein